MSKKEQRIAEAVRALDQLNSDDSEAEHSKADRILLTVLRNEKLGAVADAWERARDRIKFYYA